MAIASCTPLVFHNTTNVLCNRLKGGSGAGGVRLLRRVRWWVVPNFSDEHLG